jgi:hypothetical protein
MHFAISREHENNSIFSSGLPYTGFSAHVPEKSGFLVSPVIKILL